jgi:hypothetical protein
MSARLTIILFILVCFEIGLLLIFLPWHRSWQENNILFLLTDALNTPGLRAVVLSGYTRGAVSGLGFVNVVIGVREIVNFRTSVRAINGDDAPVSDH